MVGAHVVAGVGAACALGWSALGLALRPREPRGPAIALVAALGLGAVAALASAFVPDRRIAFGIAAAWAGAGAFVAFRPAPWTRRAGGALVAGASGAVVFPGWAPLPLAIGLLGALHAARPVLLFPALARGVAAAGAGAGAAWIATALEAGSAGQAAAASGGALLVVLASETLSPRVWRWPRARPVAVPPEPGDLLLDRYRVSRRLGGGTGGEAFLARDDLKGGNVVVKWLRIPPDHDPAALSEARALRALDHPHVVRLAEVATDPVAGAVLVMEHAEGGSLADRIARSGALSRPEFERLAREALSALEAVHAAGFLHQDLKPSNVLLDAAGRAKLADFGVARDAGSGATLGDGGPTLRPAGTARYMSPEQARGHRATPRSDLYALAVTLHEAHTGVPYVASAPNESHDDVRARVASAEPFGGGAASDPALREWFARALDPDPRRRFGSAAEMRDALLKAAAAQR